jgi:hypothetical protein
MGATVRVDAEPQQPKAYRRHVRVGLSVPIMDEPSALVDLGVAAEANGWDGVFMWHHVIGTPDFAVPAKQSPSTGCRVAGWFLASVSESHPWSTRRSAVLRERMLGRAARWDGVLLGAMTAEGGMEVLRPEAVAEVAARPGAPADIVVAAPAGTDPVIYEGAGATWVLITGWLDELRSLAAAPAPG